VILFFNGNRQGKVTSVLRDLYLYGNKDITLIDARNGKGSASNVSAAE
jgi:hypothetical protein